MAALIAARRQHPLHDYAVPAVSLGIAFVMMAGLYVGTGVIEERANAAKHGTLVFAGSFSVDAQVDYTSFSAQRIAPQRPQQR